MFDFVVVLACFCFRSHSRSPYISSLLCSSLCLCEYEKFVDRYVYIYFVCLLLLLLLPLPLPLPLPVASLLLSFWAFCSLRLIHPYILVVYLEEEHAQRTYPHSTYSRAIRMSRMSRMSVRFTKKKNNNGQEKKNKKRLNKGKGKVFGVLLCIFNVCIFFDKMLSSVVTSHRSELFFAFYFESLSFFLYAILTFIHLAIALSFALIVALWIQLSCVFCITSTANCVCARVFSELWGRGAVVVFVVGFCFVFVVYLCCCMFHFIMWACLFRTSTFGNIWHSFPFYIAFASAIVHSQCVWILTMLFIRNYRHKSKDETRNDDEEAKNKKEKKKKEKKKK